MTGTVLADISGLVAAVTSLLVVIVSLRTKRAVDGVRGEVRTQNGLTMAALADRAEGRRIEADVPEGDRTTSEQHYVDAMDKPHDEGTDP